jgi:hypothetical protein
MGTHYVRDICQKFREVAETTQFPTVKEKLIDLADTLEPIAKKPYFKTQKGTEDMQSLVAEMVELEGKIAVCQEAGAAQSICIPFYDKLEKIIKAAKTMKVRMT